MGFWEGEEKAWGPPFLQKSFLPFPHFPLLHKQHLLIARERPQIFGNDRLEMIGKGADGIRLGMTVHR